MMKRRARALNVGRCTRAKANRLRIGSCFECARYLNCELKLGCDIFCYPSFLSSSANASVGVRQPRHFLGVPLRRSQIDFISRFESAATGVSRGRYRRARLLRFLTEPFCQGACGSQNHASVPIPGFNLRQSENSLPRSNVIDWRAVWVRGSITFISLEMKCLELRSLFRNNDRKAGLALDQRCNVCFPVLAPEDHQITFPIAKY